MPTTLVLFESAYGYALFERLEADEVMDQDQHVQQSITQFSSFSKMVKLKAFLPFESAESALENCNDVSEGILNPVLKAFLQTNFPGKASKYILGVSEDKLGSAIQEAIGVQCTKSTVIQEITRGIRLHFRAFIPELKEGDVEKAQLGLGHSYSRAKVKFNVNRVDNMVIQSISILDQLDKDVNTFSMRCREWYSWHFPELSKVVADQFQYARLVKLIGDKANLTEDHIPAITEVVGDEVKAREIYEASLSSMGQDVSPIDLVNIEQFSDRVIELSEYREKLHNYLNNKMHNIAPNLSALIGEQVGARLIAKAGSLTNLSKMPASTVQILGAEKALFRALKTKSNTPKYGLIYHSSFIGKAGTKNKGRISRYVANKCAIASRLDNYSDTPTSKFGEIMKDQVEERLRFYEEGVVPRKNADVMKEVLAEVEKEGLFKQAAEQKDKKKKKKKQKVEEEQQVEPEQPMETEVTTPTSEKKKKKKKRQSQEVVPEMAMEVEQPVEAPVAERKKKKKSNQF